MEPNQIYSFHSHGVLGQSVFSPKLGQTITLHSPSRHLSPGDTTIADSTVLGEGSQA